MAGGPQLRFTAAADASALRRASKVRMVVADEVDFYRGADCDCARRGRSRSDGACSCRKPAAVAASPSCAERLGAYLADHDGWLVAIIVLCMAAWGTSAAVGAKAGFWLMLALDFIAFPVGIVDGFGVWLRLW